MSVKRSSLEPEYRARLSDFKSSVSGTEVLTAQEATIESSKKETVSAHSSPDSGWLERQSQTNGSALGDFQFCFSSRVECSASRLNAFPWRVPLPVREVCCCLSRKAFHHVSCTSALSGTQPSQRLDLLSMFFMGVSMISMNGVSNVSSRSCTADPGDCDRWERTRNRSKGRSNVTWC